MVANVCRSSVTMWVWGTMGRQGLKFMNNLRVKYEVFYNDI